MFVIYRKKLRPKAQIYVAVLLAVAVGFTAGVSLEGYYLYESGSLSQTHEDIRAIPYDCPNC